jgi:hypothetical protein
MLIHVVGHDGDMGVLSRTSAIACISAREQAAPVGLFGKFRISHFVCGVIAASRSSGRSLNRCSRAGRRDRRRLRDHDHVGIADPAGGGDHDLVAEIAGRHDGIEDDLLAAIADQDLVQFVVEAVVALELALDRGLQRLRAVLGRVFGVAGQGRRCAASIAWPGVAKSGSPDDRLMIFTPWARKSRARSVIAADAEILTFLMRSAASNIEISPHWDPGRARADRPPRGT